MTSAVPRQRPRAHDGTSASEAAVFAATEDLLTEAPLQELTVAQIIARAGISRASFYHYFASKYDVLAALVSQLLTDAYRSVEPWQAPVGRARARSMDVSLRDTVAMWAGHGHVLSAALESMYVQPQIARAWAASRELFVNAVAEQITYERTRGRAPEGPAADMVATVLLCGVERAFYLGQRGFDPRVQAFEDAGRAITHLTATAIYRLRPSDRPQAERGSVGSGAEEDGDAPDTATAILLAVGALLQEGTLDELSVAQICARAGASRATFYFYYASKDDVFAALFVRVVEPLLQQFELLVQDAQARAEHVHGVVSGWLALDETGVAVLRNAVHEWPRSPALRGVYLASQERLASALEAAILANRATTGAAHETSASLAAASVIWTVEKALAGTLAQEKHLEDTPAVVALLDDLVLAAAHS